MTLRDPKIPYRALRQLAQNGWPFLMRVIDDLLFNPPIEEESGLVYFRRIRNNADKLYTVALRISQIAAIAMECIEEGSSNELTEPSIKMPELPIEYSDLLKEKKVNEPFGGETEKTG